MSRAIIPLVDKRKDKWFLRVDASKEILAMCDLCSNSERKSRNFLGKMLGNTHKSLVPWGRTRICVTGGSHAVIPTDLSIRNWQFLCLYFLLISSTINHYCTSCNAAHLSSVFPLLLLTISLTSFPEYLNMLLIPSFLYVDHSSA